MLVDDRQLAREAHLVHPAVVVLGEFLDGYPRRDTRTPYEELVDEDGVFGVHWAGRFSLLYKGREKAEIPPTRAGGVLVR